MLIREAAKKFLNGRAINIYLEELKVILIFSPSKSYVLDHSESINIVHIEN